MGNCIRVKNSAQQNQVSKETSVVYKYIAKDPQIIYKTIVKTEKRLSDSLVDFLLNLEPVKNWANRELSHEIIPKDYDTLRIASWNLERLSTTKLSHPGYLEAIVSTILLSNADLVFLQEIKSPESLEIIINELNESQNNYIRTLTVFNNFKWDCIVSEENVGKMFQGMEYAGVLYKNYSGIRVKKSAVFNEEVKSFSRAPFMVEVKVFDKTMLIMSVHLKAPSMSTVESNLTKTKEEINTLGLLAKAAVGSFKNQDPCVILIGDFNAASSNEAFDCIRESNFFPIFKEQKTSISALLNESRKGGEYDNCWLSDGLGKNYKNSSGVVYKSIQHPFIFNHDHGWNGFASDHALIYLDLCK